MPKTQSACAPQWAWYATREGMVHRRHPGDNSHQKTSAQTPPHQWVCHRKPGAEGYVKDHSVQRLHPHAPTVACQSDIKLDLLIPWQGIKCKSWASLGTQCSYCKEGIGISAQTAVLARIKRLERCQPLQQVQLAVECRAAWLIMCVPRPHPARLPMRTPHFDSIASSWCCCQQGLRCWPSRGESSHS